MVKFTIVLVLVCVQLLRVQTLPAGVPDGNVKLGHGESKDVGRVFHEEVNSVKYPKEEVTGEEAERGYNNDEYDEYDEEELPENTKLLNVYSHPTHKEEDSKGFYVKKLENFKDWQSKLSQIRPERQEKVVFVKREAESAPVEEEKKEVVKEEEEIKKEPKEVAPEEEEKNEEEDEKEKPGRGRENVGKYWNDDDSSAELTESDEKWLNGLGKWTESDEEWSNSDSEWTESDEEWLNGGSSEYWEDDDFDSSEMDYEKYVEYLEAILEAMYGKSKTTTVILDWLLNHRTQKDPDFARSFKPREKRSLPRPKYHA